jgi:hypothetical protein
MKVFHPEWLSSSAGSVNELKSNPGPVSLIQALELADLGAFQYSRLKQKIDNGLSQATVFESQSVNRP